MNTRNKMKTIINLTILYRIQITMVKNVNENHNHEQELLESKIVTRANYINSRGKIVE